MAFQNQKTNILYLTNCCNFDCEYCYQAKSRNSAKPSFISFENAKKFINEIVERESGLISTIVLFGGEPLLNPDLFYKILDFIESKNHKFNISTTTNGYYLSKHLVEFKNKILNLKNHFSLEISYDGSGQFRRKFNNKNTDFVKELIDKIDFKFSIRYTIHSGNIKTYLKDLAELSLNQNIDKIIVNFNESEIGFIKDFVSKQAIEIFKYTQKPICYLNCDFCKRCNFEKFNGIQYQYNDSNFEVSGNATEFNHFNI